jgi:hypothetical protein
VSLILTGSRSLANSYVVDVSSFQSSTLQILLPRFIAQINPVAKLSQVHNMTFLELPLEIIRGILEIAVNLDTPYHVVRLRSVCCKFARRFLDRMIEKWNLSTYSIRLSVNEQSSGALVSRQFEKQNQ